MFCASVWETMVLEVARDLLLALALLGKTEHMVMVAGSKSPQLCFILRNLMK